MTLTQETYAELREIAGRYPQARSGLLPMLHLVQSVEGRVTPEGIEACAEVLGLTPAEVSGVATFYTMYKRSPVGTHHVGVCTNTLCAVMGGDAIFAKLREHLGVGNDETTEDGQITLEHIECNAACDYAPVMMVNWEFFDNQTPDSAVQVVDDLRAGRDVTASRGARVTSWREAERVLAGFEDGLVDEGPAAGEASLVGLSIAREHGWTAPATGAVTPTRAEAAVAASSDGAAVAADEPPVTAATDGPSPEGGSPDAPTGPSAESTTAAVEEAVAASSDGTAVEEAVAASSDGAVAAADEPPVTAATDRPSPEGGSPDAPTGPPAESTTANEKLGAAEEADTRRAESETVAETETSAGEHHLTHEELEHEVIEEMREDDA